MAMLMGRLKAFTLLALLSNTESVPIAVMVSVSLSDTLLPSAYSAQV